MYLGTLNLTRLIFISILFACISCETVVEIDVPSHQPRLSMIYVLDADSNAQTSVYIFPSRGVKVDNFLNDVKSVAGVNLQLINQASKVVDSLSCPACFLGVAAYQPLLHYTPKAGNTYMMRAEKAGFPTATATVTVPQKPELNQIRFLPGSNADFGQRARLELSFKKQTGVNYYQLEVWLLDSMGEMLEVFTDDTNSGDISVGNNDLRAPFSDQNLNQLSFTIAKNVIYYPFYYDPWGNAIKPVKLIVKVRSISQSLFLFANSEKIYDSTSDNPFSEPLNLYSNIQNGFGVFGARNAATFELNLTP